MKPSNQNEFTQRNLTEHANGFTRRALHKDSGGFTIIEVVLFLALSGAFMGIAFAGIQGRTAAVQFTDSMRSLQSFLVSERNKVQNGVNSAEHSDCASIPSGTYEDCVLLGRVVTFGKVEESPGVPDLSGVEVAVLRGEKPGSAVIEPNTDLEAIEQHKPVPDNSNEGYTISWKTKFLPTIAEGTVDLTNPAAGLHSIGWIRSPISSRIIPVAFAEGADLADSSITSHFNGSNAAIRIDTNVHTRLCFKGAGGQTASITFGEVDASNDVTGSSNVVLEFDDPECAP